MAVESGSSKARTGLSGEIYRRVVSDPGGIRIQIKNRKSHRFFDALAEGIIEYLKTNLSVFDLSDFKDSKDDGSADPALAIAKEGDILMYTNGMWKAVDPATFMNMPIRRPAFGSASGSSMTRAEISHTGSPGSGLSVDIDVDIRMP